ncbi:Calcineurin-like phosphoesterase [Paenibacillus catalpae]|uniref:Calcineurin-like phosphoesterase n=1 Tax=Paenibacillus catalpae TaxID=1045775 RepID=A0A1I2FS76_9BACL|nr:metallophosphoesterase [Paenibacillus catalpae]SFF07577.1 Calcineurin-like phosphoesterase [Paenibacillus catalpae]
MEIVTKIHTIFLMIGSTECGKSTFANEILIPGLQFQDAERGIKSNIQYLSSDAIRQEMLGFDYDKYDRIMLEASDQTFQLLFTKLKLVTSFPVNAEFVILDTTGLADDFRARVREIAHENNYNVEVILFDYRNRSDYYASERSKKLITAHINRLKTDVLRSLSKEGYSAVHKIRAKDFYLASKKRVNPEYRVKIENLDEYVSTALPNKYKYIVVGDVHECLDTFKSLLLSHGYQIEGNTLLPAGRVKDTKIVLVGDWIDKGKQTRETIQFLYENQKHFYFVLGNHENFVYKYLKGDLQNVDQELLHTYFNSTQVLASDPELLEQFQQLVDVSKPFYRSVGTTAASFYITHAPCRNKYIAKLDTNSIRHQRNFRIDRDTDLEPQLAFLEEEAVSNYPFHIFGHVAAKNAFRIKNKVHIDSGCVHGNALTSVSLSYKPFFKSQATSQAFLTDELKPLFVSERKVAMQDLGEEELRRLRYATSNKINYISGTMAPADKDDEAGQLESLRKGLHYYAERGVKEVVLQPKYMGSRCNIYLYQDIEQCFAISRNGYKIKKVDLIGIYTDLLSKFGGYMKGNNIEMLLLDGELLPWRAMGEGLIQRQFKPIEKALETELAFLKQNGFEKAFRQLTDDFHVSGFEKDQFHMPKAALSEKYGSTTYQNYKHLHIIHDSYMPLDAHQSAFEAYKQQIELYAEDGELAYKPFALLKIIYKTGQEEIPNWNTSDMYRFLSDDEFLLIDLTDDEAILQAEQFFTRLTVDQKMEGVVIKSQGMEGEGKVVPFIKVRNAEYLSIVYGYDYRFPHKYSKLMKQKNVSQKLRTSLKEYRIGQRMLEIPNVEISPDNQKYKATAASLLFEVAKEKEIDPRL